MQIGIASATPAARPSTGDGKLVYVVNQAPEGRASIGFRVDLTRGDIDEFQLPLRDGSRRYLDRLTDIGRGLVERLSTIEGIKKVWLDRNDMEITIGAAYRWRGDLAILVKEKIAFVAVDNKLTAVERRERKAKAAKQPKVTD